jgi:hypothetical protein
VIPRLYSAAFDSVRQAEGWQSPEDRRQLIGRLRLSCLVSRTVVLTDTQVLDGAMFLDLGPDGLRRLLGGDPEVAGLDRVAVAARRADLGEALLAMLHDAGSDRVRPFRFSALGLDASGQASLATLLSAEPFADLARRAQELGAASAVAELLLRCGVPCGVVGQHEFRWSSWLDAARTGHVAVEEWGPPPPWQELLRAAPYEALLGLSQQEKELIRPWRDAGLDRSGFYLWVESSEVPSASCVRLKAWYDDVYHRGAARQHGAGYIALVGSNPDRAAAALEDEVAQLRAARTASSRVVLPLDLLDGLGAMPGTTFDAARFAARTGIESWLAGERDGMRRVAYAMEVALEQPDPRRARREALLVLSAGALAAALAVAVLVLSLDGGVAVALGLVATALGFVGSGLRDLVLLRQTSGGRLAALVDVGGVTHA